MKKGIRSKRVLALVLACLGLGNGHAFEVRTHGAITRQAWTRFLAQPQNADLYDRLGIRNVDDPFKTKTYYDYRPAEAAAPRTRNSVDWYEDKIMRNELGVAAPFSVQGWVIRGAIREDDDVDPADESPKDRR